MNEISKNIQTLLHNLVTSAPPKNREIEASKRRLRFEKNASTKKS